MTLSTGPSPISVAYGLFVRSLDRSPGCFTCVFPAMSSAGGSIVDRVHRSISAASAAGSVFVAHREGRVSGLLIIGDESCAGRHNEFVEYMMREVNATVVADPDPDPVWLARIERALAEGSTDVPVDLTSRSAFQQRVLQAAISIERGEVRTYADIASAVGNPRAARAVGTALARNPIPLLVPCHRVVPSSGGVGKYGYGSELKRRLLAHEGVHL